MILKCSCYVFVSLPILWIVFLKYSKGYLLRKKKVVLRFFFVVVCVF